MIRRFSIYKGLQKPLVYRGFKGKFIGWGIGSLVLGLVGGGLIGALTSMYLGGLVTDPGHRRRTDLYLPPPEERPARQDPP